MASGAIRYRWQQTIYYIWLYIMSVLTSLHMTELLKQNITKHISLSEHETESFCNLFQQKLIKKKTFLLREGEVCKFEGFVTKGLFRVYHIDPNGLNCRPTLYRLYRKIPSIQSTAL
jgi:hypothetical protein